MVEWYNCDNTKRDLSCILNGCIFCPNEIYCKTHDKPASVGPLPEHCVTCGEYIYDKDRDTKGIFGS